MGFGLKVGHATRSVEVCIAEARKDATVRTSLLDARRIAGEQALFEEFVLRFRAANIGDGAAEFIAAKQAERDLRHERYGDSPFMVEPNIKEGKGGLRDLQTLYWIARYVFAIEDIDALIHAEQPGLAIMTPIEAKHMRRPGISCGRCAFISTTSRAGRRSGSLSIFSRSSARAWAIRGTAARTASSGSCGTTS